MRKLKNPRKPSVLIDLPYDIAPFSICKKKKKKNKKFITFKLLELTH